MTGESNFDLSESIWLKLIRELAPQCPTIALLCKTSVARSVLRAIGPDELPITQAALWKIDARRWFGASVEACLLRVEIGPGPRADRAEVFDDLDATVPETILGLGGGRLIADESAYRRVAFADGVCPLEWRQGVKHDASTVMELIPTGPAGWVNRRGETVDVEEAYVYPLRKGTDLVGSPALRPNLQVIMTQTRLGEDTRNLESLAPKLWKYLTANREIFDRRKSSIYRGRTPFAMFGVGDYSYAPYKLAISGLHKNPRFRVVGSVDGRPTMVDDTCYFLPCKTLEQAELLEETFQSPDALDLVRSQIFRDAKRPVTKALLQRIDLKALLARNGRLPHWQPSWETDWGSRSQSRSGR